MVKPTTKTCVGLALVVMVSLLQGGLVRACPGCGAIVDESADERYNKPLADLRRVYEQGGTDALPAIREVLRKSTDPWVLQRAANYLVDLDDRESIPQMESIILDLIKRVSFTTFGFGAPGFHSRLSVACALSRFGPNRVGDRIWERYDRLDRDRKSEVAPILSAIRDPHLDERMIAILKQEEDHRLMQGALEALATDGSRSSLPFLRSRVTAWDGRHGGAGIEPGPGESSINYKLLRIKAETAIFFIDARSKEAH